MSAQWQPGLERANHIRVERHRLRQKVRAPQDVRMSRALLAKLLITPHPELNSMRALDLLRWSWRMDETIALRLLYAAGTSATVTVGRLTVRQRIDLARLLRADLDALKEAEMERLTREMPWRPWKDLG